ncbi:MAG: DNA repair protein RadA [Gammaproteobacteria bacterium]|nr:DNA repair protein RadA [Gammaproteobacteria bacterium]MDD9824364.1 DNA repair protein RadA [Gammaproteobacteria bacterium]MDD9863972.1 DNA repair protein RadA [Gammaproteobacteria bacterium]
MASPKPRFECRDCGAMLSQWAGRCPDCGNWNTLQETLAAPAAAMGRRQAAAAGRILSLKDLATAEEPRQTTGIGELDRVLGGGLVPGSAILIGGDPGIGKSTLLLQALAALDAAGVASLYVTGEESAGQVASRARRLGLNPGGLRLLADNDLERLLAAADRERPAVLIVDSIQTLSSDSLSAAPGTATQLRECAGQCVRLAKRAGMAVFLVGHVTKEGVLAGPRLLEHMVDTVLYFEGDGGSRHRLLRAVKNRYGAANELGVFAMTDRGLRPVDNPSALFLSGAPGESPGSVVMITRQGNRPLLVEVQALVDDCHTASPRRLALGLFQHRLDMLLAVLHRHGGIAVGSRDVFVNVVGGIRIGETAADLPILLAVASSLAERQLPRDLAAFGEIGLAGEIRPVPGGPERLREAVKHGFRRAIVPEANRPRGRMPGITAIPAARLAEALSLLRAEAPP